MLNKALVKRPIVTEKSVALGKTGKYVFLVGKNTAASEAKKIVEAVYGVQVEKTNVINVKSKERKYSEKERTKNLN